MATAQTVSNQPQEGEFIPPPPSRRGRPPGSGRQTPTPPPTQGAPDGELEFFPKIKSFSVAEWERHIAYLYRTAPIIDTTRGGTEPKYIQRFVDAFDEDEIMKIHGSGSYLILLNERTGAKEITRHRQHISIDNPAYPPVVPKGGWLDDPRNKQWRSWFKDEPPAPAATGPGNMGEAFDFVRKIIHELRPDQSSQQQTNVVTAVLDAVKETRRELASQNDPAKWLDAVKTFAPLLAPFFANMMNPKQDTALIEMLRQSEERNREFMKLLLERKDAPAPGLSSLKETVETMALLRETFGGDGGGASTGWKYWADMLPALMQGAGQFFNGAGNGQPPRTQRAPVRIPGGPPVNPTQENPTAMATDPAAELQPQTFTDDYVNEIRQLVLANARPMGKFLANGDSGAVFADYFVEGHTLREWHMLTNFGYNNLLTLIQQDLPPAWTMLQPMLPAFQKFMNEFYAWTPKQEEPEAEA